LVTPDRERSDDASRDRRLELSAWTDRGRIDVRAHGISDLGQIVLYTDNLDTDNLDTDDLDTDDLDTDRRCTDHLRERRDTMWTYGYEREARLSREALWNVLRNVDDWAAWDTSMESVRLRGPFEVGSQVLMTPAGQEAITSVITDVVENERYADETDMEGVTLRFSHTLSALADGGTRIVHRLEISGPAADEVGLQLGPAITEDFPDAMSALIARAGG
jgi:hypothetical protein